MVSVTFLVYQAVRELQPGAYGVPIWHNVRLKTKIEPAIAMIYSRLGKLVDEGYLSYRIEDRKKYYFTTAKILYAPYGSSTDTSSDRGLALAKQVALQGN